MTALENWTVEYAQPSGLTEPKPIRVPHAWGTDVDVRWEGPAIYRTKVRLPEEAWLLFDGVSYEARVFIDSEPVGEHRGIWDSFAIDARKWSGQDVEVRVEVVKNGGAKYPVKEVLSGFLPYVFNTFGGIYKPVCAVSSASEPTFDKGKPKTCRIRAEGTKLLLDEKRFYVCGVLTWGWYPELGHTNPDEATIRREIEIARSLGFNLFKFCLWLPPHEYLELMHEAGMEAWIELPLWDPNPSKLAEMKDELRRIVLQYRHHPNVILWTCGCELGASVPAEFRKELYEMVVELTGNPMVKDNSGGSEMYGGDPREYGGFYDYHPYCDLPFYPLVLDSLMNGPREPKPILLGEFNDYDSHRDLGRIKREATYWASEDPALNDQGVRWQHDLPRVLKESRWSVNLEEAQCLRELSVARSNFIRQVVFDLVATQHEIAGTILTGWSDTPISTSGVIDDWGAIKEGSHAIGWSEDPRPFIIPRRSPSWVRGGNRPGYLNPYCVWPDEAHWRLGVRGRMAGELSWTLFASKGEPAVDEGTLSDVSQSFDPREIGSIRVEYLPAYRYHLQLGDGVAGSYVICCFDRPDWSEFEDWEVHPSSSEWAPRLGREGKNLLAGEMSEDILDRWRRGSHVFCVLETGPIVHRPFWRECVLVSENGSDWAKRVANMPQIQLSVGTDCAIDRKLLEDTVGMEGRVELLRIDMRTYEEQPYAMAFDNGGSKLLVTTLRPHGGYGSVPLGLARNPAGSWLVSQLLQSFESL